MTIDLSNLDKTTRLLFSIDLRPVQGDRFQPTGFPSLGAATYQTKDGQKLLVESAQSMANRFETTVWDAVNEKPISALDGISHVTVQQDGKFLTDSILEAHRLNSVYIERSKEQFLENILAPAIGTDKSKPVNRKQFVDALLKFDIGSLLHGVFLESLDGRLRVARALSAFIEASGVTVAPSGGVKNDRVKATKEEGRTASEGFGNVPFARDEFTAEQIVLHVNFDLAQVRGYGIGEDAEHLVVLLGLHRLRKLIDGDLRLRTACDLEPVSRDPKAIRPEGFVLPSLDAIEADLSVVIKKVASKKDAMVHTKVSYDEKIKPAKKATQAADNVGEVDDGNGDD